MKTAKNTNALPERPEDRAPLAALRRAAKRAHFISYQNGEGVVVGRNGKTIIIPPDPEMYGGLLAEVERKRAEVDAKYAKEKEGVLS